MRGKNNIAIRFYKFIKRLRKRDMRLTHCVALIDL